MLHNCYVENKGTTIATIISNNKPEKRSQYHVSGKQNINENEDVVVGRVAWCPKKASPMSYLVKSA